MSGSRRRGEPSRRIEVIVGEASAPGVSTPVDPLPNGPITYEATGTKQ